MGRRRRNAPLRVYLNNRRVGDLIKEPSGAIEFRYHSNWLEWENAIPVSLSLPLREDAYRGEPVAAVFENLLPDSDQLRRKIAERMGAAGSDAYSLLAAIGADCVGALQFIPEGTGQEPSETGPINGEPIDDSAIEKILRNLQQAPLGLSREDDFRISVAGVQEKTALLWHEDRWLKPLGTTPTTHLFKPQIGELPNGLDLSNSVENEYYCLKLIEQFGLAANKATIQTFGQTKALVIERFDRRWASDGRLLRLPQEDCCQALSVPPSRKYESDGGPDIIRILNFLTASDTPIEDQDKFLKAQIVFWLIGATDGHAKNFSVFLRPGGGFSLTPLYDVLTAQPSLATRQIEQKQMKLAMSVGDSRHYKFAEIQGRHWVETGEKGGIGRSRTADVMRDVVQSGIDAADCVSQNLPREFPEQIHASVIAGMKNRLEVLEAYCG